jgi:hypothetical protein
LHEFGNQHASALGSVRATTLNTLVCREQQAQRAR